MSNQIKSDSNKQSVTNDQLANDLNIVFFGTPEFGATILEGLIKAGDAPQLVVTRPDKPIGKNSLPQPSAVARTASKYNITLLKPSKLKDPEFVSTLSALPFTLSVVASYGKIIPQVILDIPKLGNINVHGSLLPKYRGASPIQSAILEGEKETGVTIMLMDAEMDHGQILSQATLPIDPNDTFLSLSQKMAKLGTDLLVQTIPKYIKWAKNGSRQTAVSGQPRSIPIESGSNRGQQLAVSPDQSRLNRDQIGVSIKLFLPPHEQDHQQATFTKILTREDGFVDLANLPSSDRFERMIRAYYPWPGVWSKIAVSSQPQAVSKIIKFLPGKMIQIEGKKPMDYRALINGYPRLAAVIGKLFVNFYSPANN